MFEARPTTLLIVAIRLNQQDVNCVGDVYPVFGRGRQGLNALHDAGVVDLQALPSRRR